MAITEAIDPDIHAAAAACWAVLLQTPSAVVTDIDGTISAIAATPAEAMVDPLAATHRARHALDPPHCRRGPTRHCRRPGGDRDCGAIRR